jgi:hypothetical protein
MKKPAFGWHRLQPVALRRKLTVLSALAVTILGVAWWRASAQPTRPLATFMPGSALLYLEATDFSRLLNEWNGSKVKADWLKSDNHEVFSRSNLFSKLSGLFDEYSTAVGFAPDLNSVIQIAGNESALALYEIRDLQFLYVTRVEESKLAQAALWEMRSKFEARQSVGITFYVHVASGRTVAFAFTQGYLFIGTRDDLVAQALALLAGGREPSVAAARWYEGATKAATTHGELRLVLNLESLVKSVYFRSYWVQRNVSELNQFSAGISDLTRDPQKIVEDRVLLRLNDASASQPPDAARRALAELVQMAPATAGLYKAWAAPPVDFTASLIERKLLAPQAKPQVNQRYAPEASSTGEAAGTEADLETRIDEPPLPVDSSGKLEMAPLHNLIERAQPQALLQVQSAIQIKNGFIGTPSLLAIAGSSDWDRNAIQQALTAAIETLWTTSSLGAQWASGTLNTHKIARLDGLVPLMVAVSGHVLFISNDEELLADALHPRAIRLAPSQLSYTAVFSHGRERGNFVHLMNALDFARPSPESQNKVEGSREPAFFSGNIASLSDVLSFVNGVSVTASDRGNSVVERVVYDLVK